MSGSGNDFIIIDNRNHIVDEMDLPGLIVGACRRKMSVGADGFILIEPSERADFRWRFYNADGSKAEMCGNGARCAARYAFLNQIAGPQMSFQTDAGTVSAQIKDNRVKVSMPDPADLKLDYSIELKEGPLTVSSVNTGVPHVVVVADQIEDMDVFNRGREIRYHSAFSTSGTNANFICPFGDGGIAIRTYERGVEDETLACGTGSIAAAIVSAKKLKLTSPIRVHTRGGEDLTIYFAEKDGVFCDIFLEGDARVIYTGKLWEEAWKS
jgi:diaminopimelate epimerase